MGVGVFFLGGVVPFNRTSKNRQSHFSGQAVPDLTPRTMSIGINTYRLRSSYKPLVYCGRLLAGSDFAT